MIAKLLKNIPGTAPKKSDLSLICAIGDVHGEAERLSRLHRLILERHAAQFPDHKLKIVHLGDYVDRGPDSARVIETCQRLELNPDVECVFLKGNHEDMLLKAMDDAGGRHEESWLMNGGEKTLESYHRAGLSTVPDEHLNWLRAKPTLHIDADAKMIFVHAGIDPATFPNELEETYLWTRSSRFFDVRSWRNQALSGWTVVHGHTPTRSFFPETVEAGARRINIDTGAAFGGRLTAALFAPRHAVSFCYA